jgi:hypothetical protein
MAWTATEGVPIAIGLGGLDQANTPRAPCLSAKMTPKEDPPA